MPNMPKKHAPGDHSRTIDRSLWGHHEDDEPNPDRPWFDSVVRFNPDQLGPVVTPLMARARAEGLADYTLTIEGGLFVVYVCNQWELRRRGLERKY